MDYDFPNFEIGGSKINKLYFVSDIKDIQPRKATVQQHI
jgi:hypothetical protein